MQNECSRLHSFVVTMSPMSVAMNLYSPGSVSLSSEEIRQDPSRTTASSPWFVLGFTVDHVVASWQDVRLAGECVRALHAAGKPPEFRVLQGSGDGDYLFFWFVNESAALVLDEHQVSWRPFVIGEADAAPDGARSPLVDSAKPRAR